MSTAPTWADSRPLIDGGTVKNAYVFLQNAFVFLQNVFVFLQNAYLLAGNAYLFGENVFVFEAFGSSFRDSRGSIVASNRVLPPFPEGMSPAY